MHAVEIFVFHATNPYRGRLSSGMHGRGHFLGSCNGNMSMGRILEGVDLENMTCKEGEGELWGGSLVVRGEMRVRGELLWPGAL